MAKGEARARAEDFEKVKYPAFRTRLISEWQDGQGEVEWLVQAGAYLRACWLKEENFLGGGPLDEKRTKPLWDDFTEGQLEDLRTKSLIALKKYSDNRWTETIVANIQAALAKSRWPIVVGGAVAVLRIALNALRLMYEGFWHIVGVFVIFGILFAMSPTFRTFVQNEAAEFLGLGHQQAAPPSPANSGATHK